MRTLPEPAPGEWIMPRRKYFTAYCCDCGLAHKIEFQLLKKKKTNVILMRVWRDNKKTYSYRRRHNLKWMQLKQDIRRTNANTK